MEYTTYNELEACVERHRADFDLHEPRPELWAALEKQLHGLSTETSESVMNIVLGGPEEGARTELPLVPAAVAAQPASAKRKAWAEHYSIAAALAILILAASLGEAWKPGQVAQESAVAEATLPIGKATDALLRLTPSGGIMVNSTNARLDTAVRGMETYYVGQLADRKAELNQLAPAATADWTRTLVELDSSYQQLKRVLPQHPQPEIVLKAMNRNLQYRLDILDQQLELRGDTQTAMTNDTHGEFALADSRHTVPSSLRHDR